MKRTTNVINLRKKLSETLLVSMPTQCPLCGTAYNEPALYSISSNSGNSYRILMSFECPHCSNFFAVHLIGTLNCNNEIETTSFEFLPEPMYDTLTAFPVTINALSPDFVSIFNQAERAESHNLTRICGVGYRKALEFLVKDYAIHCQPQDQDKIASMSLSQCIDKYIGDSRIKTLAKAATWLGNDEAHYLRKFEGYELDSLKNFIQAATAFIHFELQVQAADEFLASPKE